MKIRLLLALAGLAIGFALPTFAQQQNTPDPQLRQQFVTDAKKFDNAWVNSDAAFLAASYTEDAVLIDDSGPHYGRQAIKKLYEQIFKLVHISKHLSTLDQYSPHIIGTAGDQVWGNGEWTATIQAHNTVPEQRKGYWSSISVREGDTWKTRFTIVNWNVIPGKPGNH